MTSLFFDIFGRDNGATQAFQNVGTAADNAGTRLAALNTQWKAAAAAEQEATTAMEAAAQRETTARNAAEQAATRLRDAEATLQRTRQDAAVSIDQLQRNENAVTTARRDAAAAAQELASAEQNTLSAAERLTTAHNNSANAARQHSSALKELEGNTRSLGTEVDNLATKFRNADLGSTMFAAIGASIQPLLASIGQLSGALGLLPAAATAVGTAFGAAVIGVQGMGTALKDAATAEKDAQAAAQADATAQQAVGQAHTAAAAAGQQNVASLKQLVAEGAAHVASLKAQQAAGQNVTTELKTAEAAQAGNVAALKNAQAAATGNVGALNSYTGAQKTANTAVSEADAAHKKAKASADAYAASLKNLAPSAQQVVSAIIQLKPAFDGLRLDVQQHLFAGIGDELLKMGQSVLPVVQTGLSQMADALNNAMKQVSEFAQQKSSIEAYKQIFSDNAAAANILTGAIKPILQIFTDVASVGAPLLKELAQHFKDAADRAAEFVSKAKESGQLKEWIQQGITAVKELWDALKNVVAIIKDLATSQGFGPNFLQALDAVTGAIRWLIENIPGATAAVQLFFDAWVIAKIVQGLTGMVTTITTVIDTLKKLVTANEEAAVAGEASAARFSNAWKTAAAAIGIGALAVGADALLPKNTPQEEQQAQQHPLTSGYGAANRDELSGIADAIKDPGKALDDLKQELNAFPGQFQNSPFMNFFRTLPVTIQTALSGVGGAFQTIWNTVTAGANSFAQGFMAPINSAINGVKTAWGGLTGFFSTLWSTITAGASSFAAGFVAPFQTAWTAIRTAVTTGITAVETALSTAWTAIQTAATTAWTAVSTAISTAWTAIKTAVTTALTAVETALATAWTTIQTGVTTAWTAVQTATTTAWTAVSTAVQSGIQTVLGYIQALPGQIQSAIGSLASILTSAGQSAMQGFYQAMLDFYNNTIAPWLQSIAQSIQSLKGPPSTDYYILHDAGTQIMAGLHDSMQSRWGQIADWLGGLGGQIQDSVSGGGDGWRDWWGRHGRGGGGSGGPSSSGTTLTPGADAVPDMRRMVSQFQEVAGTASLSSMRVFHPSDRPVAAAATVTPQPVHIHCDSSDLGRLLFELFRNSIRAQGGNVQVVLGS
jgi:phage-related protein